MVTYICVPRGSDASNNNVFDFVRVLSKNTEPTADITYGVPANTTISIYFMTDQGTPSSDAWEAGGTFTVEFNTITGNANLRARCRVSRISSDGTIIDTGTFTAFQTLVTSTILTFSPAAPTWATAEESCANRLVIQFQIQNQDLVNLRTGVIRYGDTNSEVISTITEDSATCRRIFNV